MDFGELAVVIATCGRPERLVRGLAFIDRAARPVGGRVPVVIVDNDVEPTAERVVTQFRSDHLDCRYLRSRPRNKSAALNVGIAAAPWARWLAFTDDDTEPSPAWLSEAVAFASTGRFRVFGGRIVLGPQAGPLPRTLRWPADDEPVPGGGVFVRYAPVQVSGRLPPGAPAPFGANVFIARDVFETYGRYDEVLWDCGGRAALGMDDGELGVRLVTAGEPIGYCREAVVAHPVHGEKFALRRRLKHAFRHGWQQPLVFFEPQRRLFEPYRGRLGLQGLVRAAVGAARRNWPESCEGLIELARAMGGMAVRWSTGYRRLREHRIA